MLTVILVVVGVILLTIALVKLVDKFIPSKLKPVLMIALWVLIGFLGYQTFMSIYNPILFNQEKEKRYAKVIKSLEDIRDAQLAHRTVTGKFAGNWDNLVKFIDTAQFTLTQRRDSSVVDEELTRRYGGVETFKDIVIIDTLGFRSVKDSLFKGSDKYKSMMNVPVGEEGAKFKLQAGFLEQNSINIPVFEASVKKSVILFDQPKDLVMQENEVVSVEGVNGDEIKVGSMEEVKTIGNWPKTYGTKKD
ncbi:hypothetical protein [Jejuia pallidilutea]|jgi:hypothetical protein|uniref:Uncharacterized protein n=1 Tax=Jejuia pallidilutea TaxID=504487 RepID=A0A090VRR6_9FLAO|nr:hypothetical protein [Jejuia pallidilutea]GAL67411.1 hypothetical protein JCM19301_2763 [Jejuia pallidilutea]GAL90119.1 hypothetical protein JCM19538_860 [Jejuia pallidilutea]